MTELSTLKENSQPPHAKDGEASSPTSSAQSPMPKVPPPTPNPATSPVNVPSLRRLSSTEDMALPSPITQPTSSQSLGSLFALHRALLDIFEIDLGDKSISPNDPETTEESMKAESETDSGPVPVKEHHGLDKGDDKRRSSSKECEEGNYDSKGQNKAKSTDL